jgi:hypothetical protein
MLSKERLDELYNELGSNLRVRTPDLCVKILHQVARESEQAALKALGEHDLCAVNYEDPKELVWRRQHWADLIYRSDNGGKMLPRLLRTAMIKVNIHSSALVGQAVAYKIDCNWYVRQ